MRTDEVSPRHLPAQLRALGDRPEQRQHVVRQSSEQHDHHGALRVAIDPRPIIFLENSVPGVVTLVLNRPMLPDHV